MISGRWLRIAPEQSSMPLQTMSYWQALIVSGSCVSSASSPPCGIENGLWLKSIFLAVLVALEHREVDDPAELEARPRRSAPAPGRPWCAPGRRTSGGLRRLVGDEEHRVAVAQRRSAPSACQPLAASRNLAIGPLPAAALERRCSRGPAGPRPAPRRSACRRSCAAGPPPWAPASPAPRRPTRRCRAKTLKPEPAKTSPTSAMRSGLRRSGLSVP